ncbi:MAG: SH3 domain-containing protein [Polyangiaceae bacterium]
MARAERPLQIDIPDPGQGRPIWSRVGIVAAIGFVVGIAWPRLAGVHVGPHAPSDARPAAAADASASASAAAEAPTAAPAASSAAAAPSAAPEEPSSDTVTVGPGKIQRCFDKKGKKQESCGELQIDPLVVPKLKELGKCPAAIGLEGKMNVGFEVHFEKKEVHITKGKKNTLPGSTVTGVLQCARKEMANIALDEVPHKHARYTLAYQLTFSKAGAAPDPEAKGDGGDDEAAAGQTTSETGVSGSAVVAWDTALLRKDPKDGEVVARLVRGTKVKLVGRQNDWYKVESGSKVGWVYRGSLGL